jgi:long-chain acyl-CoA synthetase
MMIDRSRRVTRKDVPLAEQPVFKGRGLRLDFDSMAEMFTTRAQEIPDHEYILFNDQVITYGQANERANRVANYLKEKGVRKGDVVSTMVINSPEIYYNMLGAQKLGCISGPVNFQMKAPEVAYILNDSKPKVVFVGSEYMEEFAKALAIADHKPVVVEVVTDVKHDVHIADITMDDIQAKYPADECLVPLSPDDPFMLLYSSGTTGKPKGVLTSNRAEMSVCKAHVLLGISQPDDTYAIFNPMFHTNPICRWSYPATYQGTRLCVRRRFSTNEYWPTVLNYGITIAGGAPAMYHYVLNSIDPSTIDRSRLKLRYAISGAAPMSPVLMNEFKEKFNVTVIEGYGLTEVSGLSSCNAGVTPRVGSIGVAIDGQEIEIMDDNHNIMPYGEKGEICIKSDANMIGYLNNPEATAETVRDGWLHTGDMGYMDEEGYIFISGRKKEMINRGGENVYPREIELVLEEHPQISAVAVVGVPDEIMGERIKACVIPRVPGSLAAQDVKDYLKDKIAKYKIPEYVEFLDDLPRNANGKVTKAALKYVPK